jgi:hypothetical protein
MFEKAIRIATVELKEELVWENKMNFLENLWSEIKYELRKSGEVQWTFDQFIERVNQEVESRKIDLRKFRNEKNEPITNMFKKLIREIAKENNIQLSNDSLSRLLNYIRNQYSSEGVLLGQCIPRKHFSRETNMGFLRILGTVMFVSDRMVVIMVMLSGFVLRTKSFIGQIL